MTGSTRNANVGDMSSNQRQDEKLAGGGVILQRDAAGASSVLLVHRPRYDDWSFPKGKLDRDESIEQAAIREVEEETGLTCGIIRKLSVARYDYTTPNGERRPKAVHYFLMEPVAGQLRVAKDEEIDIVEWVSVADAFERLSYEFDRQLLRSVLEAAKSN